MSEQGNEGQVVSSGGGMKRKKDKRKWVIADCKKFAGRYDNEQDWKAGSPSSYKAAVSHNWVKDCLDHQQWRLGERSGGGAKLPKSA